MFSGKLRFIQNRTKEQLLNRIFTEFLKLL